MTNHTNKSSQLLLNAYIAHLEQEAKRSYSKYAQAMRAKKLELLEELRLDSPDVAAHDYTQWVNKTYQDESIIQENPKAKNLPSYAEIIAARRTAWPYLILQVFLISISFPISLPVLMLWSKYARGSWQFWKTTGQLFIEKLRENASLTSQNNNIARQSMIPRSNISIEENAGSASQHSGQGLLSYLSWPFTGARQYFRAPTSTHRPIALHNISPEEDKTDGELRALHEEKAASPETQIVNYVRQPGQLSVFHHPMAHTDKEHNVDPDVFWKGLTKDQLVFLGLTDSSINQLKSELMQTPDFLERLAKGASERCAWVLGGVNSATGFFGNNSFKRNIEAGKKIVKALDEILELTGCDLHLLSVLPDNKDNYKNSYIFSRNNKKVHYVNANGEIQEIEIRDFRRLSEHLDKNCKEENTDKLRFCNKDIREILTINDSHGHLILKNFQAMIDPIKEKVTQIRALCDDLKDQKISWRIVCVVSRIKGHIIALNQPSGNEDKSRDNRRNITAYVSKIRVPRIINGEFNIITENLSISIPSKEIEAVIPLEDYINFCLQYNIHFMKEEGIKVVITLDPIRLEHFMKFLEDKCSLMIGEIPEAEHGQNQPFLTNQTGNKPC